MQYRPDFYLGEQYSFVYERDKFTACGRGLYILGRDEVEVTNCEFFRARTQSYISTQLRFVYHRVACFRKKCYKQINLSREATN